MQRMRRWLRITVVIGGLVLLTIGVPVAAIEIGCRQPTVHSSQHLLSERSPFAVDAPGYHRDQASTYFTFPEWYIVYAAEDFGEV